jgi:hypothetical protein
MEILNILDTQAALGKRNALAKAASLQSAETIGRSKTAGALCQGMSKSDLTLVEIGDKTKNTKTSRMPTT